MSAMRCWTGSGGRGISRFFKVPIVIALNVLPLPIPAINFSLALRKCNRYFRITLDDILIAAKPLPIQACMLFMLVGPTGALNENKMSFGSDILIGEVHQYRTVG